MGGLFILRMMPVYGILALALSHTAGGWPGIAGRKFFLLPAFVREVMPMSLTDVLALLGLIGGAVYGTFMIAWKIADKKK